MATTARVSWTVLGASLLCAGVTRQASVRSSALKTAFANPERVAIRGCDGDAMEPFLSRDAMVLFFKNSNDPKVNTDLSWAERIGLDQSRGSG